MRPLPAFAAALRRKLLARPEYTPLPTCGACQRQVQPKDFGREYCKACEAERAAISEEWDAMRDAEVGAGPAVQHPPMYDCPDAAMPFLPDDEDEPCHAEYRNNLDSRCGHCGAQPGEPCTAPAPTDDGDERHARFERLIRRLRETHA